MKMSDMNQAEFELFGMLSEKLGISPISTEDMRTSINEMKKLLDEQVKAVEKDVQEKKKYLNEIEKMVSGLEKGSFKNK